MCLLVLVECASWRHTVIALEAMETSWNAGNSDLIIRKNIFTARVVKHWKRLSRKVVEALGDTLNSSGQGPKQAALSGMALKTS